MIFNWATCSKLSIGFGVAIVAAPLLFMISPSYVSAPICLVALFISVLNAFKHRDSVGIEGTKNSATWKDTWFFCGRSTSCARLPSFLSLWLGLLVLMAVFISLLPFRLEPTPIRMGIAGFFWSFLCGFRHRRSSDGATFAASRSLSSEVTFPLLLLVHLFLC